MPGPVTARMRLGAAAAALAACLALPASALAQAPPPAAAGVPPAPGLTGFVETGVNRHVLTGQEENWLGVYARGVVEAGRRDTWNGEVAHDERFGDEGTFFSIGNTHTFTDDWYSAVSVGTSAGGFFFPRYRVDAFLNRKWLEKKSLVTTIGAGYYRAKDAHRDYSGFVGATYYFTKPWIVEGGVRVNLSDPGSVLSASPFVAVTYGENKKRYVTVRYGFGNEAYQAIGPGEAIVDFPSQVLTITWRQWLTRDWGFKLVAEHYNNPFYERNGIELGIFRDF